MPKISVIVPIYNKEKYLEGCLQSIINQTYQNLEIVLVDDGSTDHSLAICEKFCTRDSRIRLLIQNHLGVGAARNRGIVAASGDYVCFIDSDDQVGKDYCKHLLQMSLGGKADISIGYFNVFNVLSAQYIFLSYIKPDDQSFDGLYSPIDYLKVQNKYYQAFSLVPVTLWGKLFKRELFNHLRCPVKWEIGEDVEILWQLFLKANRIAFKNYRDYVYSDHDPNALHLQNDLDEKLAKVQKEEIAVLRASGVDVPEKLKNDLSHQKRTDLKRIIKYYKK